MPSKRTLALTKKLLAVQSARRAAAEALVAIAAAEEEAARSAEREARQRSRDAEGEWSDYVGATSFSPDYATALSLRAIERETLAEQAARLTAHREQFHLHQQEAWRATHARVRHTENSLKNLKRKRARTAEEKKLSALEDRTTFSWWQK